MTLVTLFGVTAAGTMQESSLWEEIPVKRTNILAALSCALLVFSLVGCGAFQGTTNHLQSIQISTSNAAEVSMSAQNLPGISNTIQLYAWGNYSNGQAALLTDKAVTWSIALDPIYNEDAFGLPLPDPFSASGAPQTVQLSPTGLLTAIDPAVCTWFDTAAIPTGGGVPTPSWVISGQYDVTISYSGLTSPFVAVTLSDTGGNPYYPLSEYGNSQYENNPDGWCDSSGG